jgi:hypothetical protein
MHYDHESYGMEASGSASARSRPTVRAGRTGEEQQCSMMHERAMGGPRGGRQRRNILIRVVFICHLTAPRVRGLATFAWAATIDNCYRVCIGISGGEILLKTD